MLIRLADATPIGCGAKASSLGSLRRAGLPVPDGFVVPQEAQSDSGTKVTRSLRAALAAELQHLGDPVVAVRSSAMAEDGAEASAAGQYESVIGARGTEKVCDAIATVWSSAHSLRVGDYWTTTRAGATPTSGMAVLVQTMVPADTSGVMFTPHQAGGRTTIEASWGLGLSVVGGTVTPDTYEVLADGSVSLAVGSKRTRVDLDVERGGLVTRAVTVDQQNERALDDRVLKVLADLGSEIATIHGGPQDVEWAVVDDAVWVLQARPITAQLPQPPASSPVFPAHVLRGKPGAQGVVTGTARIVRGPSDFAAVEPGDILICPDTDPAWTPLFSIAAGVVTETGGALSHAAIVAREYRIPAVLGVPNALNLIGNGGLVALDGAAGTITPL